MKKIYPYTLVAFLFLLGFTVAHTSVAFAEDGYVYIESNAAEGNKIIGFDQDPSTGLLTLDSTTASDGNGTGDALDSQGALALTPDHTWLFAVNAGSDSISSFSVDADGIPTLADTISSGGTTPVSLTVRDNMIYVVNAGSDNIAGFTFDSNGNFTAIDGGTGSLSGTAVGPTQISFGPRGHRLVVTEQDSNMITVFKLNANGAVTNTKSVASHGDTPYGFDFLNDFTLVVANAENDADNASSASTYHFLQGEHSFNIDGPLSENQTSAFDLVIPKDGNNYAYVTNEGTDAISTFHVDDDGSLSLAQAVAGTTGDNPTDITVSGGDMGYIYNINADDDSISEWSRNADGSLTSVGTLTDIPVHAVGLVAYQ